MSLLVLTQQDVEQLLPMDACIEVMAEALGAVARGDAHQPLRMVMQPPKASGLMAMMPAHLAGPRAALGLKAICVFHGNSAKGKDTHQGGVMLFNNETGELLALINAAAITAIRTAAVSGLATRLLAREDAGVLAILGSGVQARSHLAAMACVRSIRTVRVASRRSERARSFAQDLQGHYPFPIEAVESAEAAVRGADLVVTATSAAEPVLKQPWIAAGAHINAIGASLPARREVDTATMVASSLFVDRRESALNEAGDYLLAMREGAIGPQHIRAEIGEVLIRTRPGRTAPEEITLFKSLGLAVEDVAAAEYVYRIAQARQVGTRVAF
jgi:ornithine cyclodeaminase